MADPTNRIIKPFSTSFPLAGDTLLSRVTQHELSENESKNYKLLAFRPGFALQAAELNEIQEHLLMNSTLTSNMLQNWITSTNMTPDREDIVISAPSWKGACPLFPFTSPYTQNPNQRLVYVQTNPIRITFYPGWYHTEFISTNPADDNTINGLRHWIYLNYLNGSASDNRYIFSTGNPTQLTYIGLQPFSEYVYPEDNDDDSLFDNSSGDGNTNAHGAGRFKVGFNGIAALSQGQEQTSSVVLKIDPSDKSIRYINNLKITNYI